MSQSAKRNADSAFPGINDGPHHTKRARRKNLKNETPNKTQSSTKPPSLTEATTGKVSNKVIQDNETQTSQKPPRVRSRKSREETQANALQPSEDLRSSQVPTPVKGSNEQRSDLEATNNSTPNPHKKRNRRRRLSGEPSPLQASRKLPTTSTAVSSSRTIHNTSPSQPVPSVIRTSGFLDLKSETKTSTQQKFAEAARKDGLTVLSNRTEPVTGVLVPQKLKNKQRHKKGLVVTASKEPRRHLNADRWSFSLGKGGIFIEQDPLLTADGDYLFLPTHFEVQIYATQTSLLVRCLPGDLESDIVNCALSIAYPNKLYIAYANGSLVVFDWTTNERLSQIHTQKGLTRVLPLGSNAQHETVLLLHNDDQTASATTYTIGRSKHKIKQITQVLERSITLEGLESYAHGSVLIASGQAKLLVGYSQDLIGDTPEMTYTWREVSFPGPITAFDAQILPDKSKSTRKIPAINVVVGLASGVIMQYEDLLYKLIGKEKNALNEDLIPRKLHWHRTAVNTVKWSRDRNYIISGGNETVLVVWQLDTNQKQFLPHLSTSILNLSVSAKGSEYAVRLGDNSLMILSTADLLPSTNITGLALSEDESRITPMFLHPTIAHQLVAAVPATAITKNQERENSATLLQQFDIESNVQITRQALTRNVITAKNIAPNGQRLSEPNVNYVVISYDGKWLATVDEWTPPSTDTESMYLENDLPEARGPCAETCLRIWMWNKDDNMWEPTTRINEPHQSGDRSVLGLAASNTKLEFATIGSDNIVRIWSPKARHRSGVAVKNKSNEQLYTWACTRLTECGHDTSKKNNLATSAALAYSEDGSALAASWSWPTSQTRIVHIIDPVNSQISLSLPDLVSVGDAKLAFAGRHLLCLSDTFCVVDMMTIENILTINLDSECFGQRHLATNKFDKTIAIALSHAGNKKSTKLLVLSIVGQEFQPVFETSFSGLIQGFLASPTGRGYIVIDEKSRVRTLRSAGRPNQVGVTSRIINAESDQLTKSLDSIFGRIRQPAVVATGSQAGVIAQSTDEINATSSSSLGTVLSFVSSAEVPGPVELFQRVVGVVGRREKNIV